MGKGSLWQYISPRKNIGNGQQKEKQQFAWKKWCLLHAGNDFRFELVPSKAPTTRRSQSYAARSQRASVIGVPIPWKGKLSREARATHKISSNSASETKTPFFDLLSYILGSQFKTKTKNQTNVFVGHLHQSKDFQITVPAPARFIWKISAN